MSDTTTLPKSATSNGMIGRIQGTVVDYTALLLVASLPWSTSGTLILAIVWAIAMISRLPLNTLRQELARPRSALPILFFLMGLVGMLWAPVSYTARLDGLSPFWRFLLIPLLIIHFQDNNKSRRAVIVFFGSCSLLLALSIASAIDPRLTWWRPGNPGVPFKNQITQSLEFAVCGLGSLVYAIDRWQANRPAVSTCYLILGILFLGDILFVATSRTELIVIPAILIVLSYRRLSWKGIPIAIALFVSVAAVAWVSSPYLRGRIFHGVWEFKRYETIDQGTSIGARLEFWRRSLIFVSEAPFFGHGTGSIRAMFTESATGKEWIGKSHAVGTHLATALVTPNPHNQTFAVAIQLGLVGVAIMYAMWLAHLMCFLRRGLFDSFGIIVMVQTIIGCIFNSHLFDFTEGWFYVLAVGVLIGAVSGRNEKPAKMPSSPIS